jgi:prevent-host-death family protein
MRTVGLKVLKNKLSEYVRAAAAGETVLVTDRDRVVAELVPPRAERASPQGQYSEAVSAGLIALAPLRGGGAPPAAPDMTFDQLMEELDLDRGDR